MVLRVAESTLALFPRITFGIVVGKNVSVRDNTATMIREMRGEALESLAQRGLDTGTLSTHPHVSAWRMTYSAFGVKAKDHRPTHEALARRLIRDGDWPREINPIVDIYLTNQIKHLLPHGGYDLDHVQGTIVLDVSLGDEPFEPLGGGEEKTNPREVVYRDDARILTRRWNYRDCETTKIDHPTKNFAIMIEGASEDISSDAISAAGEDLAQRMRRALDGEFMHYAFVATPSNNGFTW